MRSGPVMPRAARYDAKRVRARTGWRPPAASASPVPSRHRTHRLARSFSQGWGMPGEAQGVPPVEPEPVHPPGVAAVLGVPAAVFGQVGDLAAGPGHQGGRVRAFSAERLPPFPLGAVQQRRRAAGGQEPHDVHHHERRRLAAPLIMAALQRVLYFQSQLGGQRAEADLLMPGNRAARGPVRREPGRGRLPVPRPRAPVGNAQLGPGLSPQLAGADQAVRRRAGRRRAGRCGAWQPVQPAPQLRFPGSFPGEGVPGAQALAAGDAIAAPRCLAAGQRRVLPPPRIGGSGESRHAGLSRRFPPLVVRPAHPLNAGRAPAARHQAQVPAEHRVPRIEDELISPELRPDAGEQLLRQARRAGGLLTGATAGQGPRGRRAHRSSSKTVAEIRTRTPPRRPQACSRTVPPPARSR